jgi:hypothetical protein
MLSVRRLPSGLTHQLHGADSGLPSSHAGALLPPGLAAPSQAEGDKAPHPRGPRRLAVAAGGGDVATPRPWGLDSLSLQLHPEALQVSGQGRMMRAACAASAAPHPFSTCMGLPYPAALRFEQHSPLGPAGGKMASWQRDPRAGPPSPPTPSSS